MATPRTIEILDTLIARADAGGIPKTFLSPERFQVLGMLFNALRVDIAELVGPDVIMSPKGERIRNGFSLLEMGMVPAEFAPYFKSGKDTFLADVADIHSGKMNPHD